MTQIKDLTLKANPTTSDSLAIDEGTTNVTYRVAYPILQNYLTGLTLSNNGTDPTNDIDIAVGQAADSGNSVMITLASGLTKRLDAAWAVGTNQGMLATGAGIANATYHIFLILRPDTGVVDIAADTSASGANVAANTNVAYTKIRRIGSIVRSAAAIKLFVQDGDDFKWLVPVTDITASNPGTAAVTRTLTLPTGIRVKADLGVVVLGGTTAAYPLAVFLSDLSITDTAAGVGAFTIDFGITLAAQGQMGAKALIYTNTSAQIRSRLEQSGASTTMWITTNGWTDTRGR